MPWVDPETGEVTGDLCPTCIGYAAAERELRRYRAKITRLENEAERNAVAKRDGKTWKDALAYWQAAFPDRNITSKSVKSARATKFFQRLEAGATPEDVRLAIDAAKTYRFVVYGERRQSGPSASEKIDLEHIVSVGNDAQFDGLVEKGRAMKDDPGW